MAIFPNLCVTKYLLCIPSVKIFAFFDLNISFSNSLLGGGLHINDIRR